MSVYKIYLNASQNLVAVFDSFDNWKIKKACRYKGRNLYEAVKELMGVETGYKNYQLLMTSTKNNYDIYSLWL